MIRENVTNLKIVRLGNEREWKGRSKGHGDGVGEGEINSYVELKVNL